MDFSQIQGAIPPERYYEACITHHLVRLAEMRGRRLYPFSISQLREKACGFDFGYACRHGAVFLAQYKCPGRAADGIWRWEINEAQFWALASWRVPVYYVLPAFSAVQDWYDGLDRTSFLPVDVMRDWVRAHNGQRTMRLLQSDPLLRLERPVAALFGTALNRAQTQAAAEMALEIRCGASAEEDGLTGYWVEESR